MSMDRTFACHGSGFLPVSLLALLAFAVVQLEAQTPIYSLPFFILFPAKYRLAKNLTYEGKEGTAIMILSSNVDLELNGCALQEAAADNQAIGVLIDHQQNVTIRRTPVNTNERQRTSTSVYTNERRRQLVFNVVRCGSFDLHCCSRDALEIGAVFNALSTNWSKS
jgi:hypothetical protein